MHDFKVGDIVRVKSDSYSSNVITEDYLHDCMITALDAIFEGADEEFPWLATIKRCDNGTFRYVVYEGRGIPGERDKIYVWDDSLDLIESRRF